ncbi:tyrosinase family oxidase copper chaperone [Streptomyces abyssomicinicus]|uniref:tyrosinase family oxidase copper chaperone n=1 Tax=Streptomyces abyssomicinicus TaxID=574929 RepID=UPI001250BB2F|nr:tyrosinase family oxidase copper chaperone [Streptomyces abyssomicinicus]
MSVLRNRRGALRVLLATAFAAVTAPVVTAAASHPRTAPEPAEGGGHARRDRPSPTPGAPGAAGPYAPPGAGAGSGAGGGAGSGAGGGGAGGSTEAVFDEIYRGRRIHGFRSRTRVAAFGDGMRWHVTVDDQPLHLMRRADGSYLTMVDHYGSYPTPREAARAAVDQLLPGERLSGLSHGSGGVAPAPAGGGGAEEGGGHGVHA